MRDFYIGLYKDALAVRDFYIDLYKDALREGFLFRSI